MDHGPSHLDVRTPVSVALARRLHGAYLRGLPGTLVSLATAPCDPYPPPDHCREQQRRDEQDRTIASRKQGQDLGKAQQRQQDRGRNELASVRTPKRFHRRTALRSAARPDGTAAENETKHDWPPLLLARAHTDDATTRMISATRRTSPHIARRHLRQTP
jgi:hypothetical protein